MPQAQLLLSDYVQHYGLTRAFAPDGRPEPVGDRHSWNAPQRFSAAMMLNAPRHSDHHAHPARPYPGAAPAARTRRLPWSLPMMANVALVPPLWRRMMHPRLDRLADRAHGKAKARPLAGPRARSGRLIPRNRSAPCASFSPLALLCAAPACAADAPMTAEEFEAFATGKTLTYALGGEVYGAEQYLPGRRVLWAFKGEECRRGYWYELAGEVCFVYDDDGTPQCWRFIRDAGGLTGEVQRRSRRRRTGRRAGKQRAADLRRAGSGCLTRRRPTNSSCRISTGRGPDAPFAGDRSSRQDTRAALAAVRTAPLPWRRLAARLPRGRAPSASRPSLELDLQRPRRLRRGLVVTTCPSPRTTA